MQTSNKEGVAIVFRAWNAESKIQSTSLEDINQEPMCGWLILQRNLQQIKFDNVFRA